MSAVREHHCGEWVYQLDGPDGPLILDPLTVDEPGLWMPCPDGRTAVRSAQPFGYREHSCVPDGQGELL